MTTDAERVAAKAAAMFPDETEHVAGLLSALETPAEIGDDRVRLAILKLSEGRIDRLRELIEVARADPRGVVGEAEYPRQMHHAPGMATEDMILADRADYEAWLSG